MLEPISYSFMSQRSRLHYVAWGDPSHRPLLLLHGAMDHCRNWDRIAEAFCTDWYVVAPDLRGHGDSNWSADGSYSISSYVYDLSLLIGKLLPKPVTIVAHSMGGNIALRYTGLYPEHVNKLVAIEGVYPPKGGPRTDSAKLPNKMRRWIEERHANAGRSPKRYETIDEAASRIAKKNIYINGGQARHLAEHAVVLNEDGSYSWKFDQYVRSMPPADLSDVEQSAIWSGINCPVLLVHGAHSWVPDPAMDQRMPSLGNVQIAWIPNTGHWPQHDQSNKFIDIVSAFINDR